jgi:hypothetical protein
MRTSEAKKAYMKVYRETHRDEIKAHKEAYRRERGNARSRAWYATHREEKRAYQDAYRKEHLDHLLAIAENRRRQNLYGITTDEYNNMALLQNGRCLICGQEPSDGKALRVDHNHSTGKIRGLLCFNCNIGLGMFNDNPDLLAVAAEYLRRQDASNLLGGERGT